MNGASCDESLYETQIVIDRYDISVHLLTFDWWSSSPGVAWWISDQKVAGSNQLRVMFHN